MIFQWPFALIRRIRLRPHLLFPPPVSTHNRPQTRRCRRDQPLARVRNPIPLKRERSDEDKFKAQKAVRQELKGAYKTWLDQDVAYIITDEERKAFKNLSNDEERDSFIEQFWLRRNPNPDSPDNRISRRALSAYPVRQRPLCGRQTRKRKDGSACHIYIAFGHSRLHGVSSLGRFLSGGPWMRAAAKHRHSRLRPGITGTSTGVGENVDLQEFVDYVPMRRLPLHH